MPEHSARRIQLVHAMPGRTRFRLPWLCDQPEEARRIANELAALKGVIEVRVRCRTGSLLCLHEPQVDAARLSDALRASARAEAVVGPEERALLRPTVEAGPGSSVGRSIAALFRDLDRDVTQATEGRLDLPALVTVGLVGAGAFGIAVTGNVAAPPWYSLAWWSFRTFQSTESRALERANGSANADAQPTENE